MSEQPQHRPLRAAPVLPPPQIPSSGHAAPVDADQSFTFPVTRHPRDQAGYPTYQPHPYDRYQPNHYQPPPRPGYPPRPHAARQPHLQQPSPWGYGHWSSAPPPPRRPSGLARLLLGLLGGAAALFFALIIVSAALGTPDSSRADAIDHAPAQPSGPGSGQDDPGDAQAVLTDNPLYVQGGLANGQCPAEDLGEAGKEEQTRFYKTLMECLDETWGVPIVAAGFTHAKPGLVVFDSPVTTPCGSASPQDGRTLAFYCPGDAVMYADVPQVREFFGSIDVAYAILIGHEFAHHVQQETGLIGAFEAAVYDDYDQRLNLNRRLELQASCMGGLFLGAIADSFPIDDQRLSQLDRAAGSFGDEPGAPENQRDHGSGESNRAWIFAAFNDNDLAGCNTFVAPATAVD